MFSNFSTAFPPELPLTLTTDKSRDRTAFSASYTVVSIFAGVLSAGLTVVLAGFAVLLAGFAVVLAGFAVVLEGFAVVLAGLSVTAAGLSVLSLSSLLCGSPEELSAVLSEFTELLSSALSDTVSELCVLSVLFSADIASDTTDCEESLLASG